MAKSYTHRTSEREHRDILDGLALTAEHIARAERELALLKDARTGLVHQGTKAGLSQSAMARAASLTPRAIRLIAARQQKLDFDS